MKSVKVYVLTLSDSFVGTRANIWQPCQDMSLKEFYLNEATERRNHGALWIAFVKQNNLNVPSLDCV